MKIGQYTGTEKISALLDGLESDLEDDTDELMNDSDTEFVSEKEASQKMTFLMTNLKTFWSLKQTFTSTEIEG